MYVHSRTHSRSHTLTCSQTSRMHTTAHMYTHAHIHIHMQIQTYDMHKQLHTFVYGRPLTHMYSYSHVHACSLATQTCERTLAHANSCTHTNSDIQIHHADCHSRRGPARGGGAPFGDDDKATQDVDVGSRAPPPALLSSFGEGARPACCPGGRPHNTWKTEPQHQHFFVSGSGRPRRTSTL